MLPPTRPSLRGCSQCDGGKPKLRECLARIIVESSTTYFLLVQQLVCEGENKCNHEVNKRPEGSYFSSMYSYVLNIKGFTFYYYFFMYSFQ